MPAVAFLWEIHRHTGGLLLNMYGCINWRGSGQEAATTAAADPDREKQKNTYKSTNFIHQKVPWNKTTEEWEATLWVNNNMAVMMEPKQYKCHTTAKRFPQCKTAAQISGLMPI